MVFGTIRLRHSNAFVCACVCVFQCVSMLVLCLCFGSTTTQQSISVPLQPVNLRATTTSHTTHTQAGPKVNENALRMHTQRASDQPASYCCSDEITDTEYKRLLIHLSMEKIEKLNSSPLRASRMVWHIVGNVNYAMFAVWRRK